MKLVKQILLFPASFVLGLLIGGILGIIVAYLEATL